MNIRDLTKGVDIIHHPSFNFEIFYNDAALNFLPAAMNDITPVTLNENCTVPVVCAPLDVAGWGRTQTADFGGIPSPYTLATTVSYITNKQYTSPPFLNPKELEFLNNMMCVWADGTGQCKGDSGMDFTLKHWLLLILSSKLGELCEKRSKTSKVAR